MRGGLAVAALFAAVAIPAAPAHAQTRQHVQSKKVEVVARPTPEVNGAALKHPFVFEAPAGFAIVQKEGATFAATLDSAQAEMTASVEKGALAINESALADEALRRIADWTTAHPTGSCTLIKKELVKLGSSAMRLVFDLRAEPPMQIGSGEIATSKLARPQRELVYVVTGTSHHARIVYTAPVSRFPSLEKSFDASLHKTKGLAGGSATDTTSTGPTLRIAPAETTTSH